MVNSEIGSGEGSLQSVSGFKAPVDLNTSSGVAQEITVDLAQDKSSDDPVKTVVGVPLEISQLIESSRQLQGFISSKPSVNTAPDAIFTLPDMESTLAAVKRSSRAFLALASHTMAINSAGKPSEIRSLQAGAIMVPVAVNAIHLRGSQPNNQPSSGEKRMFRAFGRAHRSEIMANGNRFRLPDWYTVAKVALEPAGSNGEMPGPEVYLQASRRAAGVEDVSIEKAAEYREEISRMRNSKNDGEGLGGAKLEKAMEDYQKLIAKMDSTLDKVDDADPAAIELCCRNVRLEFNLKPEVLMAAIELHNALGQALESLTVGSAPGKELKCIPAPEFLGETDPDTGVRAIQRIQPVKLSPASLLAAEEKSAVTEALFEEYAALHAALMEIYEESRGRYGRDETRKKTMSALEDAVTGLVGENRERARQIILKVASAKTEAVKEALSLLLCSKELEPGPGRGKDTTPVLGKLENIELLGEALSLLITADDSTANRMAKKLEGAMLRTIVEIALKVRQNLKTGNYTALARFFDTELKNLVTEEHRQKRAAILHCLLVSASDSTARLYLKALLKNLELVDQVAGSIRGSVVGETSPVSRFVETLRAKIARRFSSDLSEYWGQVKMVKQWQGRLSKHLKILSNPGAWAGIEPNQVFYNGYLLHGYPGAGKTFLVTCMANELGLPLVIISRKEMSAVLKKKRQDSEKNGKEEFSEEEFQARFAEFMENKISQAREDMHKSGTKACMVFMDEMEAEFLKRDPATCSHEEFTRTNIMLTELEKAIRKHPEIIFVGATNHIDLVDPAALRKGRFGVHYEIKLPEKEDVIEVLEGSFRKLGLPGVKNLSGSDAFNQLVDTCIGMTPLSIQLAVDNTVVLERIDRNDHAIQVDEELLAKIKEEALESRTLNYNAEKGGKSA